MKTKITKPDTPEWVERDRLLLEKLEEAINTDDCVLKDSVGDSIHFTSTFYSNGNRRVTVDILGSEFEFYSKYDEEDIEVVRARLLYAHRRVMNAVYENFKKLFGDLGWLRF